MFRTALCFVALGSSQAVAGSMQLQHQGRVLDAVGAPITGTRTVVFTIQDGADNTLFSETYAGLALTDGYYAVNLGSVNNLDSDVFLQHGATSLQITIDGVVLADSPLGGYPAVIAHQSVGDSRVDDLMELLAPSSCPSGMSLVNPAGSERAFCAETGQRGPSYYKEAQKACGDVGRHVCTEQEYYEASQALGPSGWCGSSQWHWTGTMGERGAADGDLHLIIGYYADCRRTDWGWSGFSGNQSGPYWYRCCSGGLSALFR